MHIMALRELLSGGTGDTLSPVLPPPFSTGWAFETELGTCLLQGALGNPPD